MSFTMEIAYLLAEAADIRPRTLVTKSKIEIVVSVVCTGPNEEKKRLIDFYCIFKPIIGAMRFRWRSVFELDNDESQELQLTRINPKKFISILCVKTKDL